MEIRDIYIYMYVHMYSFFYGTFMCASTNYLDSGMTANFTWVLRTKSKVALTTAADSSIVHTLKKRKQN